MSTTVTNESELKAAFGYWDDSESSAVAGSQGAGDTITIQADTITLTTDLVLYTEDCPNLIGRNTVIEGQVCVVGSGGSTKAEWIGVTFDSVNGSNLTKSGSPSPDFDANSLNVIANQSLDCYNIIFTNSGDPSGTGNLITFISDREVLPITINLDYCEAHNAGADVISTKGENQVNANPASILNILGGYYHSSGSGGSDQVITPHQKFSIVVTSARIEGRIASGQNPNRLEFIDCDIVGSLNLVTKIIDSRINLDSVENHAIIMHPGDTGRGEVQNCEIYNHYTGGTADYGLLQLNNGNYLIKNNILIGDGQGDSGVGVLVDRAGLATPAFKGHLTIENNTVISINRGFDLRTNEITGFSARVNGNTIFVSGSGFWMLADSDSSEFISSRSNRSNDGTFSYTIDSTDVSDDSNLTEQEIWRIAFDSPDFTLKNLLEDNKFKDSVLQNTPDRTQIISRPSKSPDFDYRKTEFRSIDLNTSGDTIVIPGIPGKRVRVTHYFLTSSSGNTVIWKSGSIEISSEIVLDSNISVSSDLGVLQSKPGESISLNLDSTNHVGGHITYLEEE